MAKYRITQTRILEYGKFSALPQHPATRTVTNKHVYESPVVPYAIKGSGFMTMDPLTNQPPVEGREDFGERCYISFGEYEIEEIE